MCIIPSLTEWIFCTSNSFAAQDPFIFNKVTVSFRLSTVTSKTWPHSAHCTITHSEIFKPLRLVKKMHSTMHMYCSFPVHRLSLRHCHSWSFFFLIKVMKAKKHSPRGYRLYFMDFDLIQLRFWKCLQCDELPWLLNKLKPNILDQSQRTFQERTFYTSIDPEFNIEYFSYILKWVKILQLCWLNRFQFVIKFK